jgi:hypothetical protein
VNVSISPWRWDSSFHNAAAQLFKLCSKMPTSNDPIPGAIAKRYLQQRSVIEFRRDFGGDWRKRHEGSASDCALQWYSKDGSRRFL